jgi:hypothetical protein
VDGIMYVGDMNVMFANSIIYGDRDDEVEFSEEDAAQLNAKFNNCLIKSVSYSQSDTAFFNQGCIFNIAPGFVSADDYDFHLKAGSYSINKGDMNYGAMVPQDFDGNGRTLDIAPDLGAYEYVEQ